MGGSFAEVVQQSGPAGFSDVQTQLRGHEPRDETAFHGVAEHVLGIAVSKLQPSEHLDDFRVHPGESQLQDGLLTGLLDGFFDLDLGLSDNFFDSGWVNSTVLNQLFQ